MLPRALPTFGHAQAGSFLDLRSLWPGPSQPAEACPESCDEPCSAATLRQEPAEPGAYWSRRTSPASSGAATAVVPDGAAAPAAPRTKWRMGMSKVKLAIEVATGASYTVDVSSETMEREELATEIIDVLRRHFPISGRSTIYDQARSRSAEDLHRIGYLNRRTRWTW